MFFKEKPVRFFELVYAPGDGIDKDVEIFKHAVERKTRELEELVEVDFKKVDGIELYEKMKKVFHIYIEEGDFLKIFSIKNARSYVRCTDIATAIEFNPEFSEDTYQFFFRAMVAHDVKLKDGPYSLGKLERMVQRKDIVLMHSYATEIPVKTDIKNPQITADQYKRLSCFEICSDYPTSTANNEKFISDNQEIFSILFKNSINQKQMLIGLGRVLNSLQGEIDDALNVNSIDKRDVQLAESCKEWFDDFSKRDSFSGLQKALIKEEQK